MQPRRTHTFLGWTAAASLAGLATAYAAAGAHLTLRERRTLRSLLHKLVYGAHLRRL